MLPASREEILHNFHIFLALLGVLVFDVGILFVNSDGPVGLEWLQLFQRWDGTMCICLGVVMATYGFLGYQGLTQAIKAKQEFLATFCSVAFFVVVGQLLYGGFLTTSSMYYRNYDVGKVFKERDNVTVHWIQKKFECCGLKSPRYWDELIPPSCHDDVKAIFYKIGCQKAMKSYVERVDDRLFYFLAISAVPFLIEVSTLWYLKRQYGLKNLYVTMLKVCGNLTGETEAFLKRCWKFWRNFHFKKFFDTLRNILYIIILSVAIIGAVYESLKKELTKRGWTT